MLMATPETIWSTPKVTVATRVEQAAGRAAEHAEHDARPRPALPAGPGPNQVPRIIIPSRPMLTTPARSDQRPPRPASAIGTVSCERRAHVFGAVRACSPVISCARSTARTGRRRQRGPRGRTSGAGRSGPADPRVAARRRARLGGEAGVDGGHAATPAVRGCRAARLRPLAAPVAAASRRSADAADDLVGDHDATAGTCPAGSLTISCGMPLTRAACAARSMTPTPARRRRCRRAGCGPSSATAMPVKPRPAVNVSSL